jgi:hypothetical protein
MLKQGKNKDQMGVEMFRLLKIFGTASLCLVFFLSFFNEKRANNSGTEKTFRITDASRIFFNNIRRASYNRKANNDAKMDVFRLDIDEEEVSQNRMDLDLILNRKKNAAYLYLNPQGEFKNEENLLIRCRDETWANKGAMEFSGGNRYDHLSAAKRIAGWLEDEFLVEIQLEDEWVALFTTEKERKAFRTTYRDFMELISN